jgi:hypothetical protein
MSGWHSVPSGATVTSALEADLHGRRLRVEHRAGERAWRWFVRTRRGCDLASGLAGDAHAAERAAEDETCRVHPPVGDAASWWIDH